MSLIPYPLAARRHLAPLLTAIIGAAVFLIWRPLSTDLSNQRFRSTIYARSMFSPWNNLWFGGHHTPGYSLLAPPLGALLGPMLVGVLAVIAATAAFSVLASRLAVAHPVLRSPALSSSLFALGCLASLYGGRIAFLIGAAFGVSAVLAATMGRTGSTLALAILTGAGSPVTGLFLALIGCSVLLSRAVPKAAALALAVPPLLLLGALGVLFPEGGDFPYPAGALANTVVATLLVAVSCRRFATIRWAAAGYAVLFFLAAVLDTPLGGNVVRLVALVAPALLVLSPIATRLLPTVLAVSVLVVQLQWSPISLAATGDRAQTEARFYAPVLQVLAAQSQPLRVEVVPVATHDEAYVVGRRFPLARGWNRQLDRKHNAIFYGDRLDADEYLAWLVDTGVSMVAIADTQLDQGGRLEQQLLRDPPDYLRSVYDDGVWRVFEVLPRPRLAGPGATVTSIEVDKFTVTIDRAGDVEVKVRFSPWFRVAAGAACVAESDTGWTIVRASAAGDVVVEASLSLGALVDRDGDC